MEGKVARVPEKESDDYFHSRFETLHSHRASVLFFTQNRKLEMISIYVFRPLSSQIGACVSEQSTVISGREVNYYCIQFYEHYC